MAQGGNALPPVIQDYSARPREAFLVWCAPLVLGGGVTLTLLCATAIALYAIDFELKANPRPLVWLLLILWLCISQGIMGVRLSGPLGTLALLTSVYAGLSYGLRPSILLLVDPTPRANDPIADPRIWGGYDVTLGELLPRAFVVIAIGYVFLTTVGTMWLAKAQRSSETSLSTESLVPIFLGSWAARTILFVEGSASAQVVSDASALTGGLRSAAFLATVVTGVIIMSRTPISSRLWIGLTVSEAVWALLSASKAPILALLVFVALRLTAKGNRIRASHLGLLGVVAVPTFLLLQEVKSLSGRLTSAENFSSSYPEILRPIVPIAARFDLVRADTDAHLAGAYSYYSLGEALTIAGQSFVPGPLLSSKVNFGGSWREVVRTQAYIPSQNDVHLAAGAAAEGWALAGWLGVVLEALLVSFAIIYVAGRVSQQRVLSLAFAAAMLSQPYLFERGILGIAQGAGKSLQLAVLVAVACAIQDEMTRRQSVGRERAAAPFSGNSLVSAP